MPVIPITVIALRKTIKIRTVLSTESKKTKKKAKTWRKMGNEN